MLCKCGINIEKNLAQHQAGLEHQCRMTMVEARAKGHVIPITDAQAAALTHFGFDAHFSVVKIFNAPIKKNGRWKLQKTSTRYYSTSALHAALCRFNSRHDDRPEDTMHAALVFASVYGEATPTVLINMIDAEIEAGKIKFHSDGTAVRATRESDLVALLRANGVQSPALTLTNLMPHLLSIALAELPGCVL